MSNKLLQKYIRKLLLETISKKVKSYTLEDYQSEEFKSDIMSYINSGESDIYENIFIAWENKVKDHFSKAESNQFIKNLRNCLDTLIKTTLQTHSMKDIMNEVFKNMSPLHFRSNNESRFMKHVFGDYWSHDFSEVIWDKTYLKGKTFKENVIDCDWMWWLKDIETVKNKLNLNTISGFIIKFIIFELVENKIDHLHRENFLKNLPSSDRNKIKKIKNIKKEFMEDFQPYKDNWDFYHFVGAYIADNGDGPLKSLKNMFNQYTTKKSRDEIAAIAIPKKQSSLIGWDTIHKKSAIGFKLSGVVTSMYSQDIYSTVFNDHDAPWVGGTRKSSGFNRQPWESAAHSSSGTLDAMLSMGQSKILKPHNLQALENQKDGSKFWNKYIESFVDNWTISGIVINPEMFTQQFADSMWSKSTQEVEEEIDDCITFFIELQQSGFEIYYAPDIKTIVNSNKLSMLGDLIKQKL